MKLNEGESFAEPELWVWLLETGALRFAGGGGGCGAEAALGQSAAPAGPAGEAAAPAAGGCGWEGLGQVGRSVITSCRSCECGHKFLRAYSSFMRPSGFYNCRLDAGRLVWRWSFTK